MPRDWASPRRHPSLYAPCVGVVPVDPDKVVTEAETTQELGHRVGVFLPASLSDSPTHAQAVVALSASSAAYAQGL